MVTYRELSIKNRPGFVFDRMTNIKGLDISLVGVNQISLMNDNMKLNIITIMSVLIPCILFLMM